MCPRTVQSEHSEHITFLKFSSFFMLNFTISFILSSLSDPQNNNESFALTLVFSPLAMNLQLLLIIFEMYLNPDWILSMVHSIDWT